MRTRRSGRASTAFAHEERDGGRLAHAGGADNGEMAAHGLVDGDAGLDGAILRQAADGDGLAAAQFIDGGKVPGADTMRDGADEGILGDAAVEEGLALRRVAHFADEFDVDDDGIVVAFVPGAGGRLDLIDEADRADVAEIDRDEAADRPETGFAGLFGMSECRQACPRAIALDDAAEHPRAGLLGIAAFLAGVLAEASRALYKHALSPSLFPRDAKSSQTKLSGGSETWLRRC